MEKKSFLCFFELYCALKLARKFCLTLKYFLVFCSHWLGSSIWTIKNEGFLVQLKVFQMNRNFLYFRRIYILTRNVRCDDMATLKMFFFYQVFIESGVMHYFRPLYVFYFRFYCLSAGHWFDFLHKKLRESLYK